MTADPLVPLNTQDIVALLSLFEKACKDLSRREGSDAIIKKLGLPDKIEQEVQVGLIKQPYRKYSMSIAGWYDKPGFANNSTNRPPFNG